MKPNTRPLPAALAVFLLVFGGSPLPGTASGAAPASGSKASGSPHPSAAPAAVEYLGMTPDGERFRYRIRVNTAKPISQVDLAVTYTAAGKKETLTVVWQNIVHSKRQPIENGKSYDDDGYLGPNARDVRVELHRVVYQDSTSWTPGR